VQAEDQPAADPQVQAIAQALANLTPEQRQGLVTILGVGG